MVDFAPINPEDASAEDIAKAFELLNKQNLTKARIEAGELKGAKKWSDMTEEEKEKARESDRRARAKTAVLLRKAKEAGIEASEEEVEAEYQEILSRARK